MVEIIACWDGNSENQRHIDWVERAFHDLRPYALPGGYIALMGRQETERVQEAFGANYRRLKDLKRHYDPFDEFRSIGHISP